MALTFTTYDVFTETPYKGNPLAIVTIPEGRTLRQDQKQTIAKEFNLSETVFVHENNDPARAHERHFDIFTREAELPFAGHPTIGTAASLYSKGVRRLISKAGPIDIEQTADGALRAAVPHKIKLGPFRLPGPDAGTYDESQKELAAAERGSPVFSIVKGMTFMLIEVPSVEILGKAKFGALEEWPANWFSQGMDEGWVTRRYYFTTPVSEDVEGRKVHKIQTRLIRTTMEDPATGSAACALAAYLSTEDFDEDLNSFEITQGVEMGRESKILVDTETVLNEEGHRELKTVYLGGKAVEITSGSLRVPE